MKFISIKNISGVPVEINANGINLITRLESSIEIALDNGMVVETSEIKSFDSQLLEA